MNRPLPEGEDISYHSQMPSLSSYETNGLVYDLSTIVPPRRAVMKDLPPHLRLEPVTGTSGTASSTSPQHREVASSPLRPTTLLSRASSVLVRRQSVSPRQVSPVRERASQAQSPVRGPAVESIGAAVSPSARTKITNTAAAFSELFQGTSELVSGYGLSLKRQDARYTTLARPYHSRTTSNKSSRSSLWGRLSPSKHAEAIAENDDDDEILNLDIDEELFPGGQPDDSPASVDNLIGNANKLFMKMQIAYQIKLEAIDMERERRSKLEEGLEEEKTRCHHFKSQLTNLSDRLVEEENVNRRLQADLNHERWLRRTVKDSNARTIRSVAQSPTLEIPGKDGHRLFSGAREDSMYSLGQAGFSDDSSDESPMWSPPLTPSDSRPSTADGFGAAYLREENRALKARIVELEETVDGCLGLVANL